MQKLLFLPILLLFLAACDNSNFSDDTGEDLFFLESEDAVMPVRVMGNKASNRFVIFLHGGPGGNIMDARDFLATAFAPIEQEVAMVYWDQRCAGSSQGNCDRKSLSFDAYLSDLDKLIVLLEHQYGEDLEFHLMTHSFGGWLATVYLSEWDEEEKIKTWINIDGAYSAPAIFAASRAMLLETGQRQIEQGQNVTQWQEMIDEINTLDLSDLEDKNRLNELGYKAPQLMVDVDSINTTQADATLSTLFASPGSQLGILTNSLITGTSPFSREVFSLDHSSNLAQIELPILLLWGKYDFVVPSQTAEDLQLLVGSSDTNLIIFDRSEHTPFATEPEKFAETVVSFYGSH